MLNNGQPVDLISKCLYRLLDNSALIILIEGVSFGTEIDSLYWILRTDFNCYR